MGQTWSKFMPGHVEPGTSDTPVPEASSSPDPSGQPSQVSTEASSSAAIYQGGPFSVAAADVELSSLRDEGSHEGSDGGSDEGSDGGSDEGSDEEHDQERNEETQTTPTPTLSTSQQLSPLQTHLKGPGEVQFKNPLQASPSTAWKLGPLQGLCQKTGAVKQPRISSPLATTRSQHQDHAARLDIEHHGKFRVQKELPNRSPSQFSPDEEAGLQLAQMEDGEDEEETASQTIAPAPEGHVKVDSTKGEGFVRPQHSSAQKMLFLELDHKRKGPSGLPSLAVECIGSSQKKLKTKTLLKKPSGRPRKDLGAGKAVVGRRVRKPIGSRGISEGHVHSYDVSSRLYQIEYDNGKEEAMEWLNLQPYLLDQSKTRRAAVEEAKGTKPVRKSLRNVAAKVKKAEEYVYTERSVKGRRRKQ